MTEFGGWDMPLYYGDGIMKEHLHCRAEAGLFDVSHMLGIKIYGADRVAFAERFCPAGVAELPEGQGCLTCLPNAEGGIIDDCIITNAGDHLFLVINAGHETKDVPHMHALLDDFNGDANFELQEGKGILALQGPKAVDVLKRMTSDVDFSTFSFMTGRHLKVNGTECFVTRSGYTGEDGFELSIPADKTVEIATALLAESEVKAIGLGARDSLRLEAGLCLYGNDIDDTTTPIEAGLLWTIAKRRREEGGFVGADTILKQIADKQLVRTRRVGLVLSGKGPPPRSDDLLFTADGEKQIGKVTSGVFGPTAGKAVAMGTVAKKYFKKGTPLKVKIRKKLFDVEVVGMPFVPTNFFEG